jgi:hypothetical protein
MCIRQESTKIRSFNSSFEESWTTITVASLDEVQDLLDALEDAHFGSRNVKKLNPDQFEVAWK